MTEHTTETGYVDIPMNDWSEKQLRLGNKTATTRTDRYGRSGDRFEAAGNVYELTHVVKVPLRAVANHFYDEEGCEEKEEFETVWEEIHPRKGYEPDWLVYLHLFREIDA